MTDNASSLRIGWIGVGRMGFELAGRLLDAGADLAVYNRTAAKAEPLAARGAQVVARPADLADRDVVFTMVSASPDLLAVTLGPGGLLRAEGAAPRVLVDCSTVSADASEEVRQAAAARGAALLAAPVSGNPKVVRSGQASLAVSGPEDAYALVRAQIEALGKSVTYVGEGDAARIVKIAHNVMLGIVTQALAEITVLAEKAGVSRAQFLTFLNDSVMGSPFTRYKSPGFVSLDFTPTFTPALLRKDLDLGLDAAAALGASMPVTQLTRDRVQALIDDGVTELDFGALLLLAAKDAGLELTSEGATVDDGLVPVTV